MHNSTQQLAHDSLHLYENPRIFGQDNPRPGAAARPSGLFVLEQWDRAGRGAGPKFAGRAPVEAPGPKSKAAIAIGVAKPKRTRNS